MARARTKDRHDYYRLLGLVFIMILFGLIMVLSASSIRAFASTGDSYYYIKKQSLAALIGFVALMIASRIPLRSIQGLARPAVGLSMIMLVAVLIPGIGKSAGGATSWFSFGGFQIQPSEIAKLAVIIFTADVFTRCRKDLDDLKELFYSYAVVIILIVTLIMLQPDMGTTITICLAVLATVFVAGFDLKYLFLLVTTGGIGATYLIYSASYRLKRISAFLNPSADPLGAGYQIRQSLLAFGSGGLFGVGLGMSRQKYFYLPAAHTDFIFAIIGEELGLLGTLATIILFASFAYYGVRISLKCNSHFGRLLGTGVTSMIVLQALVNMGTVTQILPITGIPMPFISYGGSSLMVNLAAVGLLLSIAVDNERESKSRRRKSRLSLFDGSQEDLAERKTTSRSRKTKKSASRKKPVAASSNVVSMKDSKSATSAKATSKKRKADTKKRSSSSATNTTGRTKTNASDNKRRRNSGTRVSGSSISRSTTKSKKRP
ncbi:MAG: cell division protein FtsW [Candidatus Aquicultor primus]|uniref:Probable peptidoglycan glycosyltransferase FtsW n=1 Tax=Candidatus Aquicultor primus TaxID=1797195 RepID=A0A1F2UUM1_9ACTN|nr:MAG: cell division protein FtsW [Candidatus Aquicultor primus]HCG98587.1 putative lipid II flippase FtsW [Actinomycetota bacterium]